jgi:hypothetical protein
MKKYSKVFGKTKSSQRSSKSSNSVTPTSRRLIDRVNDQRPDDHEREARDEERHDEPRGHD